MHCREARSDSVWPRQRTIRRASQDSDGPADPSDRCFRSRLEARFEQNPDFTGTCQRAADVPILRRGVEGNQAVAVHAVDLKTIADSLRALAKNLRAFRASDPDFFIDHEIQRGPESLTAG
jgi:hypothetical protein